MKEISKEMFSQHERIRRHFTSHKPSAGQNREGILADFLSGHLPSAFGVDTGLITSHNGVFSHEADLVIYDKIWNTCLHSEMPKKIFLVESVYSLIEVKTQLNPRDIQDAVKKCRKFKTLPRKFSDSHIPKIKDSLFTIWAFDAPAPKTVKQHLQSILKDIPNKESPDFIVVPGKFLVSGGLYRSLSKWGQPGSLYAKSLALVKRDAIENEIFDFLCLEDNSLFVWFIWMFSWLKHAGNRCSDMTSHVDRNKIWGYKL